MDHLYGTCQVRKHSRCTLLGTRQSRWSGAALSGPGLILSSRYCVVGRLDILSRYTKFFHSLRCSASQEVQVLCRYLVRYIQSVTGKNLQLLRDLTSLDHWTTNNSRLKQALAAADMAEVPEVDKWRLPYVLFYHRGWRHIS